MQKLLSFIFACTICCSTNAAERTFDFSAFELDKTPTNFVSVTAGEGKPGEWKIVDDDVPSLLAPLTPNAPKIGKRHVLAQVSQDQTDERFPMLVVKDDAYDDFKLTTRFKCASGRVEQMAGIAFHIKDEKNYYVVRASAAGNTFKFYKFVDGVRSAPIGADVEIPTGVWHEMTVECKGNQILCSLNGKQVIPTLTDNTFAYGKLGFWTKSDSVSYFSDTKLTYSPRECFAQKVVRNVMEQNPRLIGLKIYAFQEQQVKMVASNNETELGKMGTDIEQSVIKDEKIYFGKSDHVCAVTMPLRDRNGDSVAALYIAMKSFPGQTENNAVARALPISKDISSRIQSIDDFSK